MQEQVKNTYLASNKNLDEQTVDKIAKASGVLVSSIAQKTGETIEQVQNRLPSIEQVNGYMYADEEGKGYTSNEINQVLELAQNELMNLPDDYSDVEYVNHLQKEINVLQDMLQGKLDEADSKLAWEVLNKNVKRNDGAILHQTVDTAGADSSAEISAAKKEWEEKGVESKYFKKWFGDSKVADKDGKPKLLTDDKEIYVTDGYSNNGISRYSYKGSHRAPSYSSGDVQERLENSEDVNLEEVAQGFHNQPDDYFSPQGARYYMYDDKEGLESATAVRNTTRALKSGNKNVTVKVYRAVPADVGNTKLKNGDWVTLSKSYAEIHGEENLDGDYKIIEQEVPASDVWWDGNDIREWGYDNGQEQTPDLYVKIENPKYLDELPNNWREARKLRDEGFDGVITPDGKYLVFEKMQIKSVDNQGTFDETNPNIYYQISQKTSKKAKEVISALKKIADGSEEETVKDLRNDLNEYGGTNDITFIFGDDKKGIKHIAQKHGKKTLLKVFDTVVDGKVLRFVPNKKTVILSKGNYEAVLSLDENGKKKTWLLSGWNTKEKSSDVVGEVSTQSETTQIKPTFSRQDLGAELNNIITDSSNNLNHNVKNNVLFQSAYHGTPHRFDVLKTYYQEINPEQQNIFPGNRKAKEIHKVKGGYLPAEKFIELFKNADASTIVHELAHWYLDELTRVAQYSEEIAQDLEAVRKYLKNEGEDFTREQHEKFARSFEAYILSGSARNNYSPNTFNTSSLSSK